MPEQDSDGQFSRRRFLRDASVAAVAAADVLAAPASAASRGKRRRGGPQTVAVFGGGIAGLTAAHELAERGFDVTVYERRAWGGKARSTEVPGSATGGRRPLPGEHGFRAWFGFEQNTIDTMRRIPFESNPHGVFDNLVAVEHLLFARDRGRRDLALGAVFGSATPTATTPAQVVDLVYGLLLETHLPPDAVAWLVNRIVVYLSSCDARRADQWENQTWTDFTRADRYGEDYRNVLVKSFSEVLQASKADSTSANFPCHVLELIVYNVLGRNSNGPVTRMLNRPTTEALIDPWLTVLRGHGVRLRSGYELKRYVVQDGRIAWARVRGPQGMSTVHADWYACALPVERARRLWNPAILRADPHLAQMHLLDTDWMNGMKFFLRNEMAPGRGGIICCDSPWAVSGFFQANLWRDDIASRYGDGQVRDCLSAIVSSWGTPGVLYGKPARECTPQEVIDEVWEQFKRHINDTGEAVLTDDMVHSWNIDPGMLLQQGHLVSDDPLVLPSAGQLAYRPDVTTGLPNLMLCGDYLRSEWEVGNMEAASYNARRAANAILERSRSRESPAKVIPPYRPPEWEPLKKLDAERHRRGMPNVLDVDVPGLDLKELIRQTEQRLVPQR